MKAIKIIFIVMLMFFLASCSSMKLEPANFAWPIESVITTDNSGNVFIERFTTEFNASNLFRAEFGETTEIANKELRVIRDQLGYYVMTSPGFMNVYVFEVDNGALVQVNKIFISKEGVVNPALNQRSPNIELISNGVSYLIDSKGLKRK
ncbi:hypothetical protein ASZ90_003330 [hydrocarbon metagenome]|uniref:Lipoprotein n=1 Tax=hydrocarbon metagenome TaxID=938273 RepID=A0A0W8G1I5_9ZZZZ